MAIQEKQTELPLRFEDDGEPKLSAASSRWMQELGAQTESLASMMRKPTDERPFIYELRIDLLPAGKRDMLLIAKGFGAAGPVITFHNGLGFLNVLRGFEGQLRSGKVIWYVDAYPPANYDERVAVYTRGEFYSV